ncbi:MAG: hypothetical protein JWN72_2849, partial [Thermoleophilia bacterium]|nr:hypothetical protein [Thermoleophilia bacterium]
MSGFRGGPWGDAEAEGLTAADEEGARGPRRGFEVSPRAGVVGAALLAAGCLVLGATRLDAAALGTS